MQRRSSKTRRIIAIVGLTGLAGGALAAPAIPWPTKAAEPVSLSGAQAQRQQGKPTPSALAARLTRQLGARSGGAYLEVANAKTVPVVNVTNQADARTVRAAGAVPRMVTRSNAQLNRAMVRLNRTVSTPGTGWGIDPKTNQVTVWADSSVTGVQLARLRRATARLGGMARMERLTGKVTTLASGGDAIFGGGARCSLGFNVRQGDQFAFITAGHCGNVVDTWAADQAGAQVLGNTDESSFPGNDFAIVRYNDQTQAPPGNVNLFNGQTQAITQAADPVVGQQVTRSGSTTQVSDGQVQQLNATVNFQEGTVTGMIRTNVCAEPGDSGGPLFAGNTALGLTSGGNGDCEVGGTTFFQPITEALQTFNASVDLGQGGGGGGGGEEPTAPPTGAPTQPPGEEAPPTEAPTEQPEDPPGKERKHWWQFWD